MLWLTKDVKELAGKAARGAVEQVRDVIESRRLELHDNPVYWKAYHESVLAQMKPARRRVAWYHKKRVRNAKAAIAADAALARACAIQAASSTPGVAALPGRS